MKSPSVLKALEDFQEVRDHLDPALFILALSASLVAAFVASGLYRFFYERRGTGSQVHRSFPLLSLAITTLFISVQLSIPLSLGLLGALSIIRFRTPIKEPEEVGFIMLVIAASISAATFNFLFMSLLMGMAVLALLLVQGARGWTRNRRDGVLVIQMPESSLSTVWPQVESCLKTHVRRLVMESSANRDGHCSMHLAIGGLHSSVPELLAGLQAILPGQNINLFLDRPGGLR